MNAPTAVVTLFSAARLDHALNQFALLSGAGIGVGLGAGLGAGVGDHAGARSSVSIIGVWLDEAAPPSVEGITLVHVPPAAAGLRLAAGRNAGAAEALARGAGLLVFLDADCLPGPELLSTYAKAAAEHPESVLCGPVTYLPEGCEPRSPSELRATTAPHAARPNLPAGQTRAAQPDEYRLFWSLSFACTAAAWRASGGFDEVYEGYGAEDTDFASRLRQGGVGLRWVGGAHAYHQYHPTSAPPWQHLDDIVRNAALYRERWGTWPMEGWLRAFADAGAIEWTVDSAAIRGLTSRD